MSEKIPEILVATGNSGKVRELEKLLANSPFKLRSLRDFSILPEPEETGATFVENARLKARYYALYTGIPTLADDSGLEVEALDGAPGIYSARYAGVGATDRERIEKLLVDMEKADLKTRAARFVCAIAFVNDSGEIKYTAEGICPGKIASAPRGRNGFGYDPVFIPEGFSGTFGELSDDIKQQISHRARATAKIIEHLRCFYSASG